MEGTSPSEVEPERALAHVELLILAMEAANTQANTLRARASRGQRAMTALGEITAMVVDYPEAMELIPEVVPPLVKAKIETLEDLL